MLRGAVAAAALAIALSAAALDVRVAGDRLVVDYQPPCTALVLAREGGGELWRERCAGEGETRTASVPVAALLGEAPSLSFSLSVEGGSGPAQTYRGVLSLRHPLAVSAEGRVHAGGKLAVLVTDTGGMDASDGAVSFSFALSTPLGTRIASDALRCDAGHACLRAKLAVDDAARPGPHLLVVEAFHGTTKVARAERRVEVLEPEVPVSPVCSHRHFTAAGVDLPCLADGELCEPTDLGLPYCLCFSGADASDVCSYGQRCSQGRCAAERGRSQPYIVTRSHDSCYLRLGDKEVACIDAGQLCFFRECGCLEGGRLVASCRMAQLCQMDGCVQPTVFAHVTRVEPLREGRLTVGVALTPEGVEPPPGAFSVSIGDVAARRVEHARSGAEHVLAAEFDQSRLSPGHASLRVVLQHRGEVLALRAPVAVPYPSAVQRLDVGLSVRPARVAAAALPSGVTLELPFTLSSADGGPVAEVQRSELRLASRDAAGERTLPMVGLEMREDGRSGLIRAVLREEAPRLGERELVLSVDSLGRRGEARARLSVLERLPLTVEVVSVDPAEVLQLGLVHGLDLDLVLSVEGDVGDLSERTLAPELVVGEARVAGRTEAVLSTARGVLARAYFPASCPRLPPLPAQGSVRLLKGGLVLAQAPVRVAPNPGGWLEGCDRA